MTREKFREMILWIIEEGRLPKNGDGWFFNFYNICKAYRYGKPYVWRSMYDEVLDELNVDRHIFEKKVRLRWLELLKWVQENGRKPRYSNSAVDEIEYKHGNMFARISRSKWGRTGNVWDPWYEEQILEHGLSEILVL